MKKVIILVLMLLCLVACGQKEENKSFNYTVVTPSGAPSLALLDYVNDENMTIDVVDGSDVLQAEFTSGNADFIIAPINLGAKLAGVTGNYKLAAVITWGNLHLVSTVSLEEAAEKPVAAFGEAAVPGKVLSYLSDELGGFEFEWYNAVNEASAALLTGEYVSAVLAEPILTMTKAKSTTELNEIVDIQEVYKQKTGYDSYPQAALFVNVKTLENTKDVDSLLNSISKSIELYNSDQDALSKKIDEVDLSVLGFGNAELIKKAYSRMALNYKNAADCKDEINAFLKLFNMELDESIIY